ncbi:hypothetical protein Angca_003158 [Angiostrongylus cantonensis]|nr:hypothetical protein Angca_003158 [Angiostrongylus cantonensis]
MLHVAVLLVWFPLNVVTLPETVNKIDHFLGNQDVCQVWKNMSKEEICDYVNYHDDICEGGGYLLWSQYVECQFDLGKKIALVVAGFFWMLLLFVLISSVADDFFSPCVSSIVAHLKISESVAGATFLAFGNGAPDIFGAIASVLSSPKPKAGLALGELLGAGIFVTTMVIATIIFVRPFRIDVFATLRDLIFYIIALSWILFVFLYSHQVHIWQPICYILLYAMYLITVIVEILRATHRAFSRCLLKYNQAYIIASRNESTKPISSSRRRRIHIGVHAVIPIIQISSEPADKPQDALNALSKEVSDLDVQQDPIKRASIVLNVDALRIFPAAVIRNSSVDEDTKQFVVSRHRVYTGPEARSRATSIVPPPTEIVSLRMFILDICEHLRPLSDDWKELKWFNKIMSIVKMPAMFVFKLTIPPNECSWSKAVAVMQAIVAPQWFLFAFQMTTVEPFDGSPALYVYGLVVSLVMVVLLGFFTSMMTQPRYYKAVVSYCGFIMSLSWIYFISSEVVNVVTMFGVVSQLSHEVLGLTILAWSNSIGDLVANISVVKQGYPRMAMVAAVGGPLFIVMFSGICWTLKYYLIFADHFAIILSSFSFLFFLSFSFFETLPILPAIFVQRFHLRRPHAYLLVLVYLCFITMIILTETNEVVWN